MKNRFMSRMLGFGLWALMALMLNSCSNSSEQSPAPQNYDVTVNLSTNRITVGDVVTTSIEAVHPPGVNVQFPALERGKEIVVRRREFADPQPLAKPDSEAPPMVLSRVDYDITSFRIGQFNLSTNQVHFTGPDGVQESRPFPETLLDVLSTLDSTNAPLQDLQDVVDLPRSLPPWLRALLIVLVLAILAALVVSRFVKNREEQAGATPPVIVPAHIRARLAMDALEQKGYIEQHAIEPFYVELSTIIRQYIEDRFNLRAPERTTEEFIREAAASSLLSSDHQLLTRSFLEQSDLVKFAKYDPSGDDMRRGLVAGLQLVDETTTPEGDS